MIAVVEPGKLRGTVELPSSKSYAHRLLIVAALADAPVLVRLNARNADIDATVNCLRALGAQIDAVEGGLRVRPIPRGSTPSGHHAPGTVKPVCAAAESGEGAGTPAESGEDSLQGAVPNCGDSADLRAANFSAGGASDRAVLPDLPAHNGIRPMPELFCGESGSTLRFLLPVAAALGVSCAFTGAGRLPERPNAPLTEALNAHGVRADRDRLPIRLCGRLRGGEYEIAGDISSQYITGLLFALPLCGEDSALRLTTPLASASYVDITLDVLARFGIRIDRAPEGWAVPGGQRYASPGEVCAEGDWSAAAFWLAANRLGGEVACEGLREDSAQGDRAIGGLLGQLGGEIDATDTPDLVPALAVAAAVHPGTTRITGAARLRLKESDRLSAVAQMLRALGGRAEETADGLMIEGVARLKGGEVDGQNDHRIVMAAAIAATVAAGPVRITGAEAVEKSYPAFFDDFRRLGGRVRLEP